MSFSRVLALAVSGAALGLIESVLVGALDGTWFLSLTEWHRYAWASVLGCMLLTLGLGSVCTLAAKLPSIRSNRGPAAGLLSLPLLTVIVTLLTEGRRVRDLPTRWIAVALLAAGGASITAGGVRFLLPRLGDGKRGPRLSAVLFTAATLCLWADSQVLRRLYPAFHVALSAAALALAALAALGLEKRLARLAAYPRTRWALLAACLAAPLLVYSAFQAPNLRFIIRDAAPVLGKVLAAVPGPSEPEPSVDLVTRVPALGAPPAQHVGVDLRGRDILFITVDALRADRLSAYGGTGLTPNMDRLAEAGVVFSRAYTTTPHTSYAVSSLMTGKYMREVLALSEREGEHATLAETVRRYGYRTAGFYPPALFFVDATRFAGLRDKKLGFEYAKVMFAPAAERVGQVARYLDVVEAGHPLLLWVHFFEPHEPYDPDPAFARGDSPEQRYDGEVAATDAAVGQLLELVYARLGRDTVVVLTADHGEEFEDHGGHHHGTTLFDEQVRVPLLIAAPGAITPRVVAEPTDNVDVTTTLLGALGMPPEARMRGDDLSGLLAGHRPAAPLYAYGSVGQEQMLTDGRYKLICVAGRDCRLFDLIQDSSERRNVAGQHPEVVGRLRGQLSALSASMSEREMLDLSGSAFPEALSRARLHDPTAGPLLVPLLGDPRAAIRAEAAAAVASLDYQPALGILARLRTSDAAPEVRAEAALAGLALGAKECIEQVTAVLTDKANNGDLRRRAAFALSDLGRVQAVPMLIQVAQDDALPEDSRRAAISRLARFKGRQSEQALIAVLTDVRLRALAAEVLGKVGSRRARRALAQALAEERYPEARAAEARALVALGHRKVGNLIVRFLGTDSSLPGGLEMLYGLPGGGRGGVSGGFLPELDWVRTGEFACDQLGCRPGQGAALLLRKLVRGHRPQQLIVSLEAEAGAELHVGDLNIELAQGPGQVTLPWNRSERSTAVAGQGVTLRYVALLPRQEDIPPPPPEPWDAGLPER